MSKALIVAEKPSVAADIAKALGIRKVDGGHYESDTIVISNAIGHLVEIDFPKEVDPGWDFGKLPVITKDFDLIPVERTKSQLTTLGKLFKRSDITSVVNACDAGREGELIFRYIAAYHRCSKPMERMWMQTMTPEGIRDAFRDRRPASEFTGLFHASLCRSEADLLIGANATRGLTGYQRHVFGEGELQNAGRVQTPTTAMIVDREEAIRTFVPRAYWEVHGDFEVAAGQFKARWYRPDFQSNGDPDATAERLFSREEANAIVAQCKGVAPSSVTDKTKSTKKAPPTLFDLTTLQREANAKFGFSAKQTLDIAQELYEKHKALTYPRTDSKALPEDYVATARNVLAGLGGSLATLGQKAVDQGWVVPNKRIFNNDKISDHFAIIPTVTTPTGLSADEQRIYDLVAKRFVAAFYPDAEFEVTTRTAIVAGEHFEAKGTVMVKPGWTEVYGRDPEDETNKLVPMTPGEPVRTVDVRAEGKETKAPERFTEATLLSAMEHAGRLVDDEALQDAMSGKGLGTPATRAAIIEGLLRARDGRGNPKEPFVRREKKYLVPTRKAIDGIRFLRECGIGFIASPEMTGDWEYRLKLMEEGQQRRSEFMLGICELSRKLIDTIRAKAAMTPAAPPPEAKMLDAACPKCSSPVKVGKFAYQCVGAGCSVKIPLIVLDRAITEGEANRILQGDSPQMEGFKSTKTGKKFAMKLVFNAAFDKLEFDFGDRNAAPAADAKAMGSCPKCGKGVFKLGAHYKCEGNAGETRSCDFIIYGDIASRAISESEVSELLAKRKTAVLSGFKGKGTGKSPGKAFRAALVLGNDGKVTFEFEDKR
ncbi:DNA topoisomerase [Cupriavidus sp. TMH.W2]|uniref:DNA topoisomerase n=1 Tax=Cupriavidus sp. TMH.W2 TaxID=3434465 RepID=UPI003D787F21